jgi:threonine-phosphate decarboxylase
LKEENGQDLELTIKILQVRKLEKPIHGSSEGRDILDFSVNLNPLAPPSELMERIKENVHYLKNYPDIDKKISKEYLSYFHGISKDCFLIGSGATQLIYDIALCLKSRGSRYYVISPTFCEYERAALRIGCKTFSVLPEEGIDPVFEGLEKFVKEGDVVFLCNPNNPTGKSFKAKEILELISELQRKKCFVCVDESFVWFVENIKDIELIENVENYDNLVVIRSLTKILSLPGLRIGYVASNKKVISKLELYQQPWPINSLVNFAVEFLLDRKDFIAKSAEYVKKERNRMFAAFKKIGIKIHESEVNFYLINSKSLGFSSRELKNLLMKNKIAVRDCSSFRGLNDEWIRVAVKKENENNMLFEAIKNLLYE